MLALEPDDSGRRVLQFDHSLIDGACRKAGIQPEARGFRPYMTLGRFRRPPRVLDLHGLPKPPTERSAEPEELIASELRFDGVVYTSLFRVFDDPEKIEV